MQNFPISKVTTLVSTSILNNQDFMIVRLHPNYVFIEDYLLLILYLIR